MNKSKARTAPFWKLVLLACFCAVGAVVICPAIGDIVGYLNLGTHQAPHMISLYFFGCAVGQLLYSPLSERWGAKKTLLWGVILTLGSSLLALLALAFKSFILFLISRFLMSIGAAGSLLSSFITVSHTPCAKKMNQKISILFASIAISILITTTVSDYIHHHFDWPLIIWAFILYSVGMLLLVDTLPSDQRKKISPSLDQISHRYFSALTQKMLTRYAAIFGCSTSIMYIFSILIPTITVELLGASPHLFDIKYYFPYFGFAIGSLISAFLLFFKKVKEILDLGFFILALGASLLLICSFLSKQELYTLLFPMIMSFIGLGMIVGNVATLALFKISNQPYGTAVYHFIALGIGMITSAFITLVPAIYSYKALVISLWLALFIMLMMFYEKKNNTTRTHKSSSL